MHAVLENNSLEYKSIRVVVIDLIIIYIWIIMLDLYPKQKIKTI